MRSAKRVATWIAAVVFVAGCLGAPKTDSDAIAEELEPSVLLGVVNITFRHPRGVYTESYEYRLAAVSPDGQRVEGTEYQYNGQECPPPQCVVREQGTTGDFIGPSEQNGSQYSYLRTASVAYEGNWTVTIEERLYRNYAAGPNDHPCSYVRFAAVDRTPLESPGPEAGYAPNSPECLDPGTYTIHYDGKAGQLLRAE